MDFKRVHAIIIGAPRSGTTSLWRYLANHPDVSASRVKEVNFFASNDFRSKNYEECFTAGGLTTLEASPIYFHEHSWIAPRIGNSLPNARLSCVLREPSRRLVAAYRSERDWHGRVSGEMTFTRYAEIVENDKDPTPINPEDADAALFVRNCSLVGNYANILSHYLEFYPVEQLHVQFLDMLKQNPEAVVLECCSHFGLDPARFPKISYTVENEGVNVRNLQVFHALRKINGMLEPVLNRIPQVRAHLKKLHHVINGAPPDRDAEDEARGVEILKEWYRPANRKLSGMLEELYPNLQQPDWLTLA